MRISATRFALPLAVLGLTLAGCSGGEGGTPSPETTTTPTKATGTSQPPSTSTPSGGGSALADFDSCGVLESVAGQFGLTEIEEVGAQECQAEYSASAGVTLKAWPELGVAEATGGPNAEISDTQVSGRKAKLVEKAFSSSACMIAIEVGPTSRVDVIASANVSLEEACDAATKVATAVEPKLPE